MVGWMVVFGLVKCLGKQIDICLVEFEEIGIVGVGEVMILMLYLMYEIFDLDECEFVQVMQVMFKFGISFENWCNVGENYFYFFGYIGKGYWMVGFYYFWLEGCECGLVSDYGDYCLELCVVLDNCFVFLFDNGINYVYYFDVMQYG